MKHNRKSDVVKGLTAKSYDYCLNTDCLMKRSLLSIPANGISSDENQILYARYPRIKEFPLDSCVRHGIRRKAGFLFDALFPLCDTAV